MSYRFKLSWDVAEELYAKRHLTKLQLKKMINLEYGKEFKADFDTLVDTKGLNKEDMNI